MGNSCRISKVLPDSTGEADAQFTKLRLHYYSSARGRRNAVDSELILHAGSFGDKTKVVRAWEAAQVPPQRRTESIMTEYDVLEDKAPECGASDPQSEDGFLYEL
eukprot:ANDGO_05099.mRNA.1 hypothetical protein